MPLSAAGLQRGGGSFSSNSRSKSKSNSNSNSKSKSTSRRESRSRSRSKSRSRSRSSHGTLDRSNRHGTTSNPITSNTPPLHDALCSATSVTQKMRHGPSPAVGSAAAAATAAPAPKETGPPATAAAATNVAPSIAPVSPDSHGAPAARLSSSNTAPAPIPAAPAATDPVIPPSITSPTPSTASRASALLSRLGLSPFTIRSRNRNVVDFHIRPDEPYKNYSAGDTVRGHVNIAILKPIRITHLVVSLHGYVLVFKDSSAKAKANGTAIQPRGGISQLPQYHGNGLASLFQDEQVLAGEGRLDAGRYEFRFELIFPGAIGLPSSIDFERGTVSYIITATLTRPTTIAPTMSCEKRVMLVEKIDIGHLPPPRSRTIFLEPISKRARRKRSAVLDKAPAPPVLPEPVATNPLNSIYNANDHASEAGSADRSVTTSESLRHGNTSERNRGPVQIDLRSEISGGSGRSISTAVSRRSDATPLSHVSAYQSPAKQKVVNDKTITATIELLKGGCLAGDMVTVRVSVQHIKRLKSLTGIIATLFRQSKIDSAPPASLFSGNDLEDSRRVGDDGYPRSRTGLAGLSLSSSSSTSIFRKDLDQNTAPLIIDPLSLHASVTVSLKLPDDAFPTIRGVPGGMVSFRYHVEVIVDLGGKLSSQVLQGGQSSNPRFGQYSSGASDNAHGPRIATNIIDTAPLRRQKGVVSISMETVVGTMDSSRQRKSFRIPPRHQTFRVLESDEDDIIRADANDRMYMAASSAVNAMALPAGGRHHAVQPPSALPTRANSGPRPPSGLLQPDHHSHTHLNGHAQEVAPAYIPQPQMPDTQNMSEKERIRQAETRLLPSQPLAAGPSCSPNASSSWHSAAAPPPPDDDDIYDAQDSLRRQPSDVVSSRPEASHGENGAAIAGPSAPTEDDLNAASPARATFPVEDKQELERRRLISEASAPPEFPEDMRQHTNEQTSIAEADAEPSAPVLDEDEEELAGYGVSTRAGTGGGPSSCSRTTSSSTRRSHGRGDAEQLPAYER